MSPRKCEKLFRSRMNVVQFSYDVGVFGDWNDVFHHEFSLPYFLSIQKFVAEERRNFNVFPPEDEVLRAFHMTSLHDTKVVILGQDPYHGAGQAHGLAFSVTPPAVIPPSLRNIFTELHDDIGVPIPTHGDLSPWSQQGVLLLNTSLTVREGQAGSHSAIGWETFTDAIIRAVNEKTETVVFILWGAHARSKRSLITHPQHVVIEGVHPSPLSAYRGFFGSRPFSQANAALRVAGRSAIDWGIGPA